MAQEVERILGKDEVISSTLISSSKTTLRRGFFDILLFFSISRMSRFFALDFIKIFEYNINRKAVS